MTGDRHIINHIIKKVDFTDRFLRDIHTVQCVYSVYSCYQLWVLWWLSADEVSGKLSFALHVNNASHGHHEAYALSHLRSFFSRLKQAANNIFQIPSQSTSYLTYIPIYNALWL